MSIQPHKKSNFQSLPSRFQNFPLERNKYGYLFLIFFFILSFFKTGTSFQLKVQFYYLNNLDEFKIGDKFYADLRDSEKKFRYDCKKSLQDIESCQDKLMVFHFADSTHLAFDSMIYDGITKSLIMIQITKNENHSLKFIELNGIIKLNREDQQTPYENVHTKYYDFFNTICDKNLVQNYFLQWLTPKKFPKLIEKIENKLKQIKNLKFQNSSYCNHLWEQIDKERNN